MCPAEEVGFRVSGLNNAGLVRELNRRGQLEDFMRNACDFYGLELVITDGAKNQLELRVDKMSVSTIHYNHGSKVVQAHEGAGGARIDGKHGRHLEVRYDETSDTFVIEADSSNIRVETGSNKIWVTKR